MYTDVTPILLERLELLASFEIADLDIANFSAICDGLYPTEFSFSNPTITYAGNPFPVDVAHSLAAHNNGTVNGSSNAPHPMELMSTATVTVQGEAPVVSPLLLEGSFPTFTPSISGGGSSGTLTWNAPNVQITQPDVIVLVEPVQIDFELSFRGLSGNLSLTP